MSICKTSGFCSLKDNRNNRLHSFMVHLHRKKVHISSEQMIFFCTLYITSTFDTSSSSTESKTNSCFSRYSVKSTWIKKSKKYHFKHTFNIYICMKDNRLICPKKMMKPEIWFIINYDKSRDREKSKENTFFSSFFIDCYTDKHFSLSNLQTIYFFAEYSLGLGI